MIESHIYGSVELEEPRQDVDVDDYEDGHDEHPRLQVVPRPNERVAHYFRYFTLSHTLDYPEINVYVLKTILNLKYSPYVGRKTGNATVWHP